MVTRMRPPRHPMPRLRIIFSQVCHHRCRRLESSSLHADSTFAVAQNLHHGVGVESPVLAIFLHQLRSAHLPRFGIFLRQRSVAETSRKIEGRRAVPISPCFRMLLQTFRSEIETGPYRKPVGNIPTPARDALCGPVPSGALQDPRLFEIRDQKRIVIGERRVVLRTGPALSVLLQQIRDDVQGLARGSSAFQTEAHQVHAKQGLAFHRFPGPDGLVPDDHAVGVGAHLRSPHPVDLREQHLRRPFGPRYFYVRAGQVAGAACSPGIAPDALGLSDRPVAVLSEDDGSCGG
eukprot:CAMPEP_0113298902 /NCGR_PEP_ID=MMETSP0010_2-20120614/1151_1 /TAXON_ID=216773 ORGANISM="Corethron hystrix, Strain 308" /NCGR_SAMPLE_ID=MMETSP0010_2 /ASSEMBLY_ACC=CAM_ASM_000155 /LENGTH=290 /DNA_ID=CAMNT_0000152029 /DNA_START=328 /DNA_END=1197 /DNA_ORIENTATION=+ /assembly_acc=CAM_ASM_000155